MEIEGITIDEISEMIKVQTTNMWWILMLLTIIQWNARSLLANGQDFKKYIDELNSKPSVVCIQEYWLKPQLKFILQEYNVIHRDMELEVGQQLL